MEDQFLTPLEKIEKAMPSNNLYLKIEANIFENKIIPLRTISLVAASILLLLFVNFYTLKNNASIGSNTNDTEYADQLVNDFEIY
ncbi:MAG: hypothetical protein AB8B74_03820 [Crocinitomicaceae bacterium]